MTGPTGLGSWPGLVVQALSYPGSRSKRRNEEEKKDVCACLPEGLAGAVKSEEAKKVPHTEYREYFVGAGGHDKEEGGERWMS